MAGQFNKDNNQDDSFSDINITPFVDVVLVLLVIFMVATPMLVKNAIEINLPKTSNGENKGITTLGISITANGQILLNGKLVTDEQLEAEAKSALTGTTRPQALISADLKTEHGYLVKVIDIIKSAGINNFAIQVEKKK